MMSMPRKIFFLILALFCNSSPSYSCPSFVYAYQIPFKKKFLYRRGQTSLWTFKEGGWFQIPLQVNAGYRDGSLEFNPKENAVGHKIRTYDRFSFDSEKFSASRWDRKKPPCDGKIVQIRARKGFGYLAFCREMQRTMSPKITYNGKERLVRSSSYLYKHDSRNHLSFEEIRVLRAGSELLIASNAEQVIQADVKNFFTMTFDASDIQASLSNQLPGSVGLLGLLKFYLKIFFFSIELALTPEVQFYDDSLYMPMSLHSPVDASSMLNVGSGVFYSWQSPSYFRWDIENSRVPIFNGKGVFHENKLSYCRGARCRYRLLGRSEGEVIELSFSIERRLVKLNFYPQLITDMGFVNKEFEDEISESPKGRIGVFFESSQLPKGDHYWDFWISLVGEKNRCPAPVSLKSLRAL